MNLKKHKLATNDKIWEKGTFFEVKTRDGKLIGWKISFPEQMLDEEEKGIIFSMLYPVALDAFSQQPSSEKEEDIFSHIFSADGLIIVFKKNDFRAIAFRLWNVIEYSAIQGDILYLAGMCVKKKYQGIGIGSFLLNYIINDDVHRQYFGADQLCPLPPCKFIALRTQNPIMKMCFDKAVNGISYPKPNKKEIPEDIKEVGKIVARFLGDENFNPDTLTSKGTYGSNLYGKEHRRVAIYSEQFDSLLDSSRGDSMICLWRR